MNHKGRAGAIACGVLTCVAATSAASGADEYAFTIDAKDSSLMVDAVLGTSFAGSIIGNYNQQMNPGGTRTLPGLVGGGSTTNSPIAISGTGSVAGDETTSPSGSFTLLADFAGGTVELVDLSADLLAGVQPEFPVTATITIPTFRTAAPDSIYFAATVPLPFGTVTMTSLTLAQTGPSSGTLSPAGPGMYTFTINAQAAITATLDLGGASAGGDPIDVPLVLTGTLTVGDVAAVVEMSSAIALDEPLIKAPVPGPQGQPLGLPTILPPGQTANVLLTLTFNTANIDMAMSLALEALGVIVPPPQCNGDVNGDQAVDFDDLNLVLGNFGAPGGAGDADGDLDADFDDLNLVLGNFGAAC